MNKRPSAQKLDTESQIKRSLIYCYGFDQAGFSLPDKPVEHSTFRIEFLPYLSEVSLEGATGVIMPSGIFESIESHQGSYGGGYRTVRCDKEMLAERQRQIFKTGHRPWLCFLLRRVDNNNDPDWTQTDLAKIVLNIFFGEVHYHDPNPHIDCKVDEFREYITKFGIARTSFGSVKSSKDHSIRIIAEAGQYSVASVINGWIFTLPLPSGRAAPIKIGELTTLAAQSISEYLKRNEIMLPPWLSEIQFQREPLISKRIAEIEKEIVNLTDELEIWKSYKGVLCATGDPLVRIVASILESFFALQIKVDEKYIEDALILENDVPAFVLEIKGVNGGMKREHINQTDSHRERLGLGPQIPGMLIINDFMKTVGLEARAAQSFDKHLLDHARNSNVKILRTSTLFKLMLMSEAQTAGDRQIRILALFRAANPLVTIFDE